MRSTIRSLRDRSSGPGQDLRNALRRMVVVATDAVLWALDGFEDAEGNVEREEAEVFPGIGIYARPAGDSDGAEAVVVKIGGQSGHPAVVATRDQRALQAYESAAGAVSPGEVVVFNGGAAVKLTAGGEIHAGAPGGPFAPLATKADIDALIASFNEHLHTGVTTGGGSSGPPAAPAADAVGTQKLRAQ